MQICVSVSLEKPSANRELNAVRLDCKPKLFYCNVSPVRSHGDGHGTLCQNNSEDVMLKTCIFQMS